MNGSTESCANCRFWFKFQSGKFCRRFPPIGSFMPPAVGIPAGDVTIWPRTEDWQWCGEWRSDAAGGGVVHALPVVETHQVDAPPTDQPV